MVGDRICVGVCGMVRAFCFGVGFRGGFGVGLA